MIIGIGTDIVEIKRIEKAICEDRFLNRYFTEGEKNLFKIKKNRTNTIAGNFAAKEAISKAMGTGFSGFGAEEIEILRNDRGMPYVQLFGRALKKSEDLDIKNINISISHCEEYAIAYVIMEGGI